MGAGGPPHRYLERIRARYPLSLHGVGLSIGGDQPLDKTTSTGCGGSWTARIRTVSRTSRVAELHETVFLNDLLPIPYTRRTLRRVCEYIDEVLVSP